MSIYSICNDPVSDNKRVLEPLGQVLESSVKLIKLLYSNKIKYACLQ